MSKLILSALLLTLSGVALAWPDATIRQIPGSSSYTYDDGYGGRGTIWEVPGAPGSYRVQRW